MIVYEYWWFDYSMETWIQTAAAEHNDLLMVAAITNSDCKYAVKEVHHDD